MGRVVSLAGFRQQLKGVENLLKQIEALDPEDPENQARAKELRAILADIPAEFLPEAQPQKEIRHHDYHAKPQTESDINHH